MGEGEPQHRRRRVDRVTAPDFLEGLEQRPTAELRAMRNDCREEEPQLSYARRLLQGRLDIALAELERRESGSQEPLDLLTLLPKILADEPSTGQRQTRAVEIYTPEGPLGHRPLDAVLEDPVLGRLPDLTDAELREFIARLRAQEREVSQLRRTVLDHFDRLQAELIVRYREGQGAVDEIVASAVGGAREGDGSQQAADDEA